MRILNGQPRSLMAPNRKVNLSPRRAVMCRFLWPVLLIALAAPRALAIEDYNLSINAGETYVIKDLDRDVTALVNFFDSAHPFTVQSSSAGRLVVLGVAKGNGMITVARNGERVRYHIAVNAIFDAKHPLAAGTTPAALTDDDTYQAQQHVSASAGTPTPASPADAKPTAAESVPVTGPAPIVRDSKISAEPGDATLVPDAASAAPPSPNSTAPAAAGDVSVSSDTSPPDRRSAPSLLSSAASHPHLTSPATERERDRQERARGRAPVATAHPAVVASAGPATRAAGARSTAPSTSSDKADEADSDSAKTAPAKPLSTSPSAPAIAAPPKPPMVASVESNTTTPRPARRDTEGSHLAESPSPSNPSAEHASSVGLVPSQSVNLPPPSPSLHFTSNPPASNESASGGEPDSEGPRPLPPEAILLTSGMSRIYDFPARIKRVSISDTNVADIEVINPHQVMLFGRQPGFTSFVVWDRQGNVEERQILTDKRGPQQVMLNVVIAEINRGRLETEGLNYSAAFTKMGISLVSLPGLVATPFGPGSNLTTSGAGGSSSGGILPPGGNLIPLILSPNLTYGLSAQNSNVLTQTFFQFLEDHNLGRVLARPRLLANSGEQARFLSGGEIPIIISQALNTSIVFKQFGTAVTFLPTVFARHDIQLTVKSEVSSPDFSQGVVENGFSVPAFVTRRAQTAVRMREQQTLIIAGLILDQTTSNVNKVPFLGDIPFLGYAFRTSNYNHSKTELVMTVTPEIVQPIPTNGEVALPTERPPLSREEIRTGPLNPPDVTRPRLW